MAYSCLALWDVGIDIGRKLWLTDAACDQAVSARRSECDEAMSTSVRGHGRRRARRQWELSARILRIFLLGEWEVLGVRGERGVSYVQSSSQWGCLTDRIVLVSA